MSVFSECFMSIKNSRKLTGVQIAELCNKERSTIFQWLNGKRYPATWDMVEDIVKGLKISGEEYLRLKEAYEKTVLKEEVYQVFEIIKEIFELVEAEHSEKRKINPPCVWGNAVCLPEFVMLNNKMEILVWIQKAIGNLFYCNMPRLYLKLQTIQEDVLLLLKMICSNLAECKVEEIVYLYNGNGAFDVQNFGVLKSVVELFLQCDLENYYLNTLYQERNFEENYIISDDFVIVFDADMQSGMLSANREWIEHYKSNFRLLKQAGERLVYKEFADFVNGENASLLMKKDEEICICVSRKEQKWIHLKEQRMMEVFREFWEYREQFEYEG